MIFSSAVAFISIFLDLKAFALGQLVYLIVDVEVLLVEKVFSAANATVVIVLSSLP